MNYLTKTEPQAKAERIASRAKELANHVESVLKAMHNALAQDEDPQAILDVFDTNAGKVLSDYGAMFGAVQAINPDTTVPAPDLTVFVPNDDGTVTYVAPPEPEPEPEA